jgi:membrane-associated phospholipid phosphatase
VTFSARREVLIALGTYVAYLAVGRHVLKHCGRERGRQNAERLVELEKRLGVHFEQRVQEVALRFPRAMHGASVGYAVANVTLSAGWLIRAFRRRDDDYHRERRAAVIGYLGALPVFLLLPTAPPRTLDGYVDTIAASGVDIEHPFLLLFYNPVAAMPSLHCAFAVITGSALAARRRGLRRLAWRAYAPAVALVVVATGNHYTLDVAAGYLLGAVARWVAR